MATQVDALLADFESGLPVRRRADPSQAADLDSAGSRGSAGALSLQVLGPLVPAARKSKQRSRSRRGRSNAPRATTPLSLTLVSHLEYA